VPPPQPSFSAEAFLRDLTEGQFDGRIGEELNKLTSAQLREVSRLMKKRFESTEMDREE
jgi:hypothetical protein